MRSSHLIASERKEKSGRRNSMCKGPEVGNFSSCLGRERDSEKLGRWNGGKLAYSKGRKYALNKTHSLLTVLWNLDVVILVLPGWCSGKASAYNAGDTQETRFDPLRGKWQPTPVFLPGRIPRTEEPGGLQSMWLHRVGHDWAHPYKQLKDLQHGSYIIWFSAYNYVFNR